MLATQSETNNSGFLQEMSDGITTTQNLCRVGEPGSRGRGGAMFTSEVLENKGCGELYSDTERTRQMAGDTGLEI